jgi:hypothetical protein
MRRPESALRCAGNAPICRDQACDNNYLRLTIAAATEQSAMAITQDKPRLAVHDGMKEVACPLCGSASRDIQEWIRRGVTLDPTAHWNHFTGATLSRLMEKAGCGVVYAIGAASFVSVYHRAGLDGIANPRGRLTRAVLPSVGAGVCVIGRKPSHDDRRA